MFLHFIFSYELNSVVAKINVFRIFLENRTLTYFEKKIVGLAMLKVVVGMLSIKNDKL